MSDATIRPLGPIRVLWQAYLRRSWWTHCAVLLSQGGLFWMVVSTRWPISQWIVLPLLLAGVLWEGMKIQQRILKFQGPIAIRSDDCLIWHDQLWLIRSHLMTPWGVWLWAAEARWRWWLAKDSMSTAEWRALCRILQQLA